MEAFAGGGVEQSKGVFGFSLKLVLFEVSRIAGCYEIFFYHLFAKSITA